MRFVMQETPIGVEPISNRVAAGCLAVQPQRRERLATGVPRVFFFQCPRQDSNLRYDLRRVACDSATLRGPRPARQASRVVGGSRTRRRDIHRVACQPLQHDHHRCPVPRPGFEPGTPRSKRGMMVPFHHRGFSLERKVRESNPPLHFRRPTLAEWSGQPISGYLPNQV